jgi:hypothetical protein
MLLRMRPVQSSLKHSNERFSSLKHEDIFDWMSDCWFSRKALPYVVSCSITGTGRTGINIIIVIAVYYTYLTEVFYTAFATH